MSEDLARAAAVDVVLVGYDVDHTERALAFFEQAFGSLPIRNRVLVANRADVSKQALDGWTVLNGTNSLGEFSGWQEGIDWIRATQPATTTLFANDTLGVFSHLSLLKRIALRHEIKALKGLQWTGFADILPPPRRHLEIDGLEVPNWVSTYCFVLTRDALARLGWKLYETERLDACVTGGTDEGSFFTDKLSPDLRSHLVWWLFGGGWRRSQKLDSSSTGRLNFKARCICAELLLSARCRELGILLKDPSQGSSWAARFRRLARKVCWNT